MTDANQLPHFDQDLYICCQQQAYDDGEGQALALWAISEYKDCYRHMKKDLTQINFVCHYFLDIEYALRIYLKIHDAEKAFLPLCEK